MNPDVEVIGAGLSGLTTAWFLTEAGARVHLREAATTPGGLIQTSRTREGLIETAARAFVRTPRVEALFAAAGVEACPTRQESRRRYIFRGGRPRRWPLSPLESVEMAARLVRAWCLRSAGTADHESVEAWGHRVLGEAATTWAIGPVMQGIYASPPSQLSARATVGGPKLRGPLIAPRGGMGTLIDGLLHRLHERGATCTFGTPVDVIQADVPTVICTNAAAAARLLEARAPDVAQAIGCIRTVSLASATAFYHPSASDAHGFGVLFPRSSGVRALGVLFNADMFPDRGSLRSETWIYGGRTPGTIPLTDAEMHAAILSDRRKLTGRSDCPVSLHRTQASLLLPLYDDAVLQARTAVDGLPPRLAVTGNYLGNLGVSKLVESAAAAAARIIA